MSDERNAAQTAFADEGGDERGLVDRRVVTIEGLVRVAEAFEVECDHPVAARERRNDVAPGKERPAEAMQENERRPFAGLLDIKAHRERFGSQSRRPLRPKARRGTQPGAFRESPNAHAEPCCRLNSEAAATSEGSNGAA